MSPPFYLVDTNILIDHLRVSEPKATAFLQDIEDGNFKAFISIITECEILSAKMTPTQLRAAQDLLTILPSLILTSPIARIAARLRREHNLSTPDALIVATAISGNLALATRDKAFRNIPGLLLHPDF